MSDQSDPKTQNTGKRVLEDTMAATIGAAVGAGLSTLVTVAVPLIVPIVPLGLLGGSILGVLIKEFSQKAREKEQVFPSTRP
jgi:hypothetical protein